jgi:hypothetical protein
MNQKFSTVKLEKEAGSGKINLFTAVNIPCRSKLERLSLPPAGNATSPLSGSTRVGSSLASKYQYNMAVR